MTSRPPLFDMQGHLLDIALHDVAQGDNFEEADEHLEGCLFCRVRLARLAAASDLRLDLDAVARALPTPPPVPPAVQAALAGADREAVPEPGDVWLTTGRQRSMVWLRKITGDVTFVQPVVFDTEMADDHTLVLAAEANPLAVPLAVFCSLDLQVDRHHLDRKLFALAVDDAVNALRTARKTGTTIPSEVTVGPPLEDPNDERHEFRQLLADRLSALSTPDESEQDSTVVEIEDRLEQLRSRRPGCTLIPCGEPVVAAADARGWKAIRTVREIDAFVVVVYGSLDDGSSAAALALLDVASATAVAFVDNTDDYETRVYDATALAAERIVAPSGARLGIERYAVALDLVDALAKHLEEMVMPDDRGDIGVSTEQFFDDIGDIVDAEALAALTVARSRRFQRFKGEAFKALTDDDSHFIAEVLRDAANTGHAAETVSNYARSQ
jgi:hypothetical protein